MKPQENEQVPAVSASQRDSWARLWRLLISSKGEEQQRQEQMIGDDSPDLDTQTRNAVQSTEQKGDVHDDS